MADDEFKPFDINQLHNRAAASTGRQRASTGERQPTVMELQKMGRERRSARQADATALQEGHEGGQPCYTLHGQPVRDGQVMEIYTNRANGFVRGQVILGPWPTRPRLLITLWNAWGKRDVDGLPPRVGTWELAIPEGAMCRFTGALPQEID